MSTETYSDGTNTISITIAEDGVTVDAQIRTKPPYKGELNVIAARAYAKANGLKLQK